MRRERPTPPPPPPKGKDRSDKARPLSKKLSSRKAKESPLKNTPPNEEGKKIRRGVAEKVTLAKEYFAFSLFRTGGLQNSGIASTEEEEEEEGAAN